jgi:urease accessory protein
MKSISAAFAAAFAALAVIVSSTPAQAHGGPAGAAAGGAMGGLLHPLLGLDHLTLLVAVGAAAATISWQLLVWAFAGALAGAAIGATGGVIPGAEGLAALAISAVGFLLLAAGKARAGTGPLGGVVVAVALAIHGILHGLEAPQDSNSWIWWGGALVSSACICGGTALLFKQLPASAQLSASATKGLALVFVLIGALLAIGSLGPLAAGAGA